FRFSKIFLTFSSILIALLCTVIVRTTPSIVKDYAKLILLLIYVTTQFDIYTHLIFAPQYIMPEFCIYRMSPLINLPLNPGWGFIIWVTLVALNAPLYGACFIHRHQIIVPASSLLKLHSYVHCALLIVIATPCLTYGYSYYLIFSENMHLVNSFYLYSL
ncbi:hypothetical protein PENTCL1PPCAC_3173, partial [Pristionchus entomophagus]